MLATSTILLMCGLKWSVAINDQYYKCTTSIDKDQCSISTTCFAGTVVYDKATNRIIPDTETITLQCNNKKQPQATSMVIYNQFAAAISCISETFVLPYDDPEENKPWEIK